MQDISRTIQFPFIPESFPPDIRQFYVELERALLNTLTGDVYIAGNQEVDGYLRVHGLHLSVTTITSATTLNEFHDVVLASGTYTVTLPTASNHTNKYYTVKNTDTGTITVNGVALAQNEVARVISDGTNWINL